MSRFRCAAVASALLWLVPAGAFAQAVRSIVINTGTPQVFSTNAAIYAVPEAMGFWRQEGLSVRVEGAAGAGPALQQLIAGRVEMTVSGAPAAMELINQGAALRIVGSEYSFNTYFPAVLADSPIRRIEDFRGKTVGLTGLASTNAIWIKALLKLNGIDADHDLSLVSVGEGAGALQSLLAKRVDALQLYEAMYDSYEARGVRLRRFDDSPALAKLSFTQGLVVRGETVEKNRAEIVGILRGMAKGTVWAKTHPEEAVRMHWKLFPLSKPQNVPQAQALADETAVLVKLMTHFTTWSPPGKFGAASSQSVESVRDTLASLHLLSKTLPAEAYFDASLIDAANDFDAQAVAALPPVN